MNVTRSVTLYINRACQTGGNKPPDSIEYCINYCMNYVTVHPKYVFENNANFMFHYVVARLTQLNALPIIERGVGGLKYKQQWFMDKMCLNLATI